MYIYMNGTVGAYIERCTKITSETLVEIGREK